MKDRWCIIEFSIPNGTPDWSAWIAVLAAVVSVVALVRSRSLNEKFLKFEEENQKLIKLQITQILDDKLAAALPSIEVSFERIDRSTLAVTVANHGRGIASNVEITFPGLCKPPVTGMEKTPLYLDPGAETSFSFHPNDQMKTAPKVEISYDDSTGGRTTVTKRIS